MGVGAKDVLEGLHSGVSGIAVDNGEDVLFQRCGATEELLIGDGEGAQLDGVGEEWDKGVHKAMDFGFIGELFLDILDVAGEVTIAVLDVAGGLVVGGVTVYDEGSWQRVLPEELFGDGGRTGVSEAEDTGP